MKKQATTKNAKAAKPVPATPAPEVSTTTVQAEVVLAADPSGAKGYVSKTDPNSKYHLRDRSSIAKPVSVVRDLCESHVSEDGEFTGSRKTIIEEAIGLGVNKHTAATQFSLWKADRFPTRAVATQPVRQTPTPMDSNPPPPPAAKLTAPIFDEGYEAYQAGVAREESPYDAGTANIAAWNHGWDTASEDDSRSTNE